MPKKKLTKTQVKRKMKVITNGMYDLLLDKMGHADSNSSLGVPKLMELHKTMMAATKRIK